MLVVNFSGMKWKWVPKVERDSDGGGLWYVEFRWLGFQATLYGRVMASDFIGALNIYRKVFADEKKGKVA